MQVMAYIAVSFLVMPMIIILINNLFSKQFAARTSLYLAGAVSVIQVSAAIAGFFLLSDAKLQKFDFSLFWDITNVSSGRFSLNSFALVLLFCIGLVSFVSVLIANQTVKKRKSAFSTLLMTLLLGMNGMAVVTDLFSLYVFLEIVGISSFVMIAMFKSDTELEGSLKYLVMSALASIMILMGLSFIFMKTGSLKFADIGMSLLGGQSSLQTVLIYVAFILLIAGFAIKAGVVPFHSWLPDAHQSANTAVSILLSGIVIKVAGILGFVVITNLFDSVPAINITLAAMGTVSIVAGALLALRQTHFKRIVAYSSVSQMGYILLALSTGSVLGLIGAVFHIFNHAVAKSTLFSNAAALHEQTGTLDINKMGGLQNKMPVTGISSITAFLSMTGIPPLAGFWSKLIIIIALWDNGSQGFAIIAILASIFTAAYFLRMQTKVFFGELPERFAELKEVGGSIKFAEIMLTIVMIAAGVVFPLVLLYLKGRGIL
jgi:multicomponent Na+:H+ antiporter subunit D